MRMKFPVNDPFNLDESISRLLPQFLECAVKSELHYSGMLVSFVYSHVPQNGIWTVVDRFAGRFDIRKTYKGYEYDVKSAILDENVETYLGSMAEQAYCDAYLEFKKVNRNLAQFLSDDAFILSCSGILTNTTIPLYSLLLAKADI